MKHKLAIALLLVFWVANIHAEDSLPLLKDGKVPQNLAELWAGYEPKKEPLEIEIKKEWESDGVVCRVVRYKVGTFKGTPSIMSAFYAFPKGGKNLPGLVQIHGGGQSASLDSVFAYAKRGYAGISINWGGNKLNFGRSQVAYEGLQTDWGKLDATHPPQRNKSNHFAGSLAPDEYTFDAVESPRNSNWFLVLIAARRAITFLEQQPEVDPTQIGVFGHSMGGKLTTNLAGIDKRVKAAVPSCGGSGDLLESQTDLPGGRRDKRTALELACVSDNAYIPLITCPTLWLSPTNDFHAHIDNMAWNWRNFPDDRVRFSISPHFNHRHSDEHILTEYLWFEEHLKGATFKMPQTPKIALELKTTDGVPMITVTPDESKSVQRVDIYYSSDSHALTRFWSDAKSVKVGKQWKAACPVMNLQEPIFAFANVVYETPAQYTAVAQTAGHNNSATFAISSRMLSVTPAQLQMAGVKATDKPDRLIDDGTRGWHDWYLLNWGHPPLWTATTRKLKDPKWRGPDGATLQIEIKSLTDNKLVLTFNCNAWGAINPGKPAVDYIAVKELKGSPEWQQVSVSLKDLVSTNEKAGPLTNWQSVTEFSISPSGTTLKDGKKVKVDGKAWQGPREIRNLRWVGGEYKNTSTTGATLSPEDFKKNFNDAIKKSLEQEKINAK